MKIKFLVYLFILTAPHIFAQAGDWEKSLYHTGGDIKAIAKHPSGSLFLATRFNACFRSDDNGITWYQNADYPWIENPFQIYDMTIAPNGNIFICSAWDVGIRRSTDEGVTWQTVTSDIPEEEVFTIAADEDGYVFAGTRDGVFVSNNNGASWIKTLNTSSYYVKQIYTRNKNIYAVHDRDGIYKSIDHGASWTQISFPSHTLACESIIETDSGNIFIALTYRDYDIYKRGINFSDDGGETWQEKNSGLNHLMMYSIIELSNGDLLASSTNNNIYRSTNRGDNWKLMTAGKTNSIIISFMEVTPDILIAATNGAGIMRSTDGGYSWDFCSTGLPSIKVETCVELDENTLLFSTNGLGLFSVNRFTNEWTNLSDNLPDSKISNTIHYGREHIIIGTTADGIFDSYDSGKTWIKNVNNFSSGNIRSLFKVNENIILASTGSIGGLYRSDNKGLTWKIIRNDFTYVFSIAQDDNKNIYACNVRWIYKSADEGISWERVGEIPSRSEQFIYTENGIFYACSGYGHIYRSSDNCNNWIDYSRISSYHVNDMRAKNIAPVMENILFASTFNGILESTDNGTTWHAREDLLNDTEIGFVKSLSDGTVLASNINGIYKFNPVIAEAEEYNISRDFQLYQNYPNPFNPTTNIQFTIPSQSYVSLKIYDMLGREIRTLAAETLSGGTYTYEFNADGLSSGIYFYRLETEGHSESKSMIYLK